MRRHLNIFTWWKRELGVESTTAGIWESAFKRQKVFSARFRHEGKKKKRERERELFSN
jgi:hypothetical protein